MEKPKLLSDEELLKGRENMKIIASGRLVDDSCVFCGKHGLPAGGHYFEAIKQDRLGGYVTKEGWIVMPHIANCEFQICPDCQLKSYKQLEESA